MHSYLLLALTRHYEAELVHARWAMLGAIGCLIPEILSIRGVELGEPVWWKVWSKHSIDELSCPLCWLEAPVWSAGWWSFHNLCWEVDDIEAWLAWSHCLRLTGGSCQASRWFDHQLGRYPGENRQWNAFTISLQHPRTKKETSCALSCYPLNDDKLGSHSVLIENGLGV
jgi:hypothetical protein